jgi:hypothetical protein
MPELDYWLAANFPFDDDDRKFLFFPQMPHKNWSNYIPSWKLPLWQWLLLFAFCVCAVFLFSTAFYWQSMIDAVMRGRDTSKLSVFEFIPAEITRRGAWFLVLPVAYHFIRIYRLQTLVPSLRVLLPKLSLHLAFSIAFSLVSGIVTVLLCYIVMPLFYRTMDVGNIPFDPFQKYISHLSLVSGSVASFLAYWLLFGIYHAVRYARAFRFEFMRSSALEKQLTHAQLHALQMQLNPHFLFNALHSVSSLLYEDIRRADTMITRLGDFLRLTLASPLGQHITLEQELDFVRRYLDIEQMRFEERLRLVWEIAPETCSALVPTFLLQPLVENALKHGIMPSAGGGILRITSKIVSHTLHLEVQNTIYQKNLQTTSDLVSYGNNEIVSSPLRVSSATAHTGIGLQNTRERLECLYSSSYSLSFGMLGEQDFLVKITLPFLCEN